MGLRTEITSILLAVVLTAAAACGLVDAGGPPPELLGTWQLTAGGGPDGAVPLLDTHPVTLTVAEDGQVGGTAACNGYGGDATVGGGRFEVGTINRTMMACAPDEAMTAETRFLTALEAVTSYTLVDDGLRLTGPGVELSFVRAPDEVAAGEDAP